MLDSGLKPTIANKTLQKTVGDLRGVSVWQGCWRFGLLGAAMLSSLTLAWTTPSEIGFWLSTVSAGVFYALWLICTHDMAHHTLLGWPRVENVLARLISWPMLWPVGVYSELHRLHHGWNGLDLRDPERYQWTLKDYQQASPWLRWYVRHQWPIDIFILGGAGVIVKTLMGGRRFQDRLPQLRAQLVTDLVGMALVQGCLIAAVVVSHGSLRRYFLVWLCLERVVGMIAQTRGLLEHYGLWQQAGSHQLTQLYSSRNVHTSRWFSWLIGGLNYHAVHHAFPDIPFDRLPEAHERVQTVLDRHGMPAMTLEPGYLSAVLRLVNGVALIPDEAAALTEI